jgi:hypothetical protein
MRRRAALVKADDSEELIASITRGKRVRELGTTLAVTNNLFQEWCLLGCYAVWFLQEPHGVTTQKTPFFIVTAVKTSNLTIFSKFADSFHPDNEGDTFLRNVGSYRSHTA